MRYLVIVFVSGLLLVGCGEEESIPSCTETMTDLYAIDNCMMYDISVSPPAEMLMSEAVYWCRQVVNETENYCSSCRGRLVEWLNCRPTACVWNESAQMFLANDCNDELDALVVCCN